MISPDSGKSFYPVDRDTRNLILDGLGVYGHRGLAVWESLVSLANERRISDPQPCLEDITIGLLAHISFVSERHVRRILPLLELLGVLRVDYRKRKEHRITITKGYWPQGGVVKASGSSREGEGFAEIPPRLRPAYDKLRSTGKMPQLSPLLLQQIDGSYPDAGFLERVDEFIPQLLSITGTITDPASWLRKRASEMDLSTKRSSCADDPRNRKRTDEERFGD